jgi:hypothetical protein
MKRRVITHEVSTKRVTISAEGQKEEALSMPEKLKGIEKRL